MATLSPSLLLVLLALLTAVLAQQRVVQLRPVQPLPADDLTAPRVRRAPQFGLGSLFGYGGGHHGASHAVSHTSTYGLGPFYASFSSHHANNHHSGGYKPHHGYGHRPYGGYGGYGGYGRPGGYGGGYRPHGHYGGGGLFSSFLDF